jgi:hypothetical protein
MAQWPSSGMPAKMVISGLKPERRNVASSASWIGAVLSPREHNNASFRNEGGRRWALPGDPIPEDDRLWLQYLVLVNLYKFYLEIALKSAVWYFATTGAILTYFFSHIAGPDARPLLFVLLFLSFASFGFGYLHFRGARHMHEVLPWLEYIALSLRIPGRPHVEFIAAFLLINSILYTAVAAACSTLFVVLAPRIL